MKVYGFSFINPTSTFRNLQSIMKKTTNHSSFFPTECQSICNPQVFFAMYISSQFAGEKSEEKNVQNKCEKHNK